MASCKLRCKENVCELGLPIADPGTQNASIPLPASSLEEDIPPLIARWNMQASEASVTIRTSEPGSLAVFRITGSSCLVSIAWPK
jgi:hypothetical protein